uniref:YGGT family protein n=1 Tax=Arundo donax TaxID=35708 RepID=A0A0A9FLX2_ARUDO
MPFDTTTAATEFPSTAAKQCSPDSSVARRAATTRLLFWAKAERWERTAKSGFRSGWAAAAAATSSKRRARGARSGEGQARGR